MATPLTRVVMVVMTIASEAHAADVDWKVYGGASIAGPEICFYEANGVVHTPDGNVRAWTKCLAKPDMDGIDIEHDFGGKILEDTVQKTKSGYVPPFAVAEGMDLEKAIAITQYEETANISGIEPHSTIFYELNCAQKTVRELSISFSVNGKYRSSDEPRPWTFIPPEGNGASLLKLLCPLR